MVLSAMLPWAASMDSEAQAALAATPAAGRSRKKKIARELFAEKTKTNKKSRTEIFFFAPERFFS